MYNAEDGVDTSSTSSSTMRLRDWRQALRSPPTYRIVNRTLRNQKHFITIVACTGMLVLIILYMFPNRRAPTAAEHGVISSSGYNRTYPLTAPIKTSSMHTFRIGIITDLDKNSLSEDEKYTWHAYYKKGYLSYSPTKHTIVVTWDSHPPTRLSTHFAMKGRGMELSELVVYDGKLLTFDDRTGMVFHIANDRAVPWLLLMDGDGTAPKGFKAEWASVQDEQLVVGSMGKEWTTPAGDFEDNNPQWVKRIGVGGQVAHVSWIAQYERLREALGIHFPGYMIHESGAWSSLHRRWFFLPRRCSHSGYNETLDEIMGCSVLLSADVDMYDVKSVQLPNKHRTRGFSTFKFVPTSEDRVIVALRTEEIEGKTATYVTAFDIDGNVLLDDTYVSDLKYEGLEFI